VEIRAALDKRGIGHLVADTAKEANAKMQRKEFEPLFAVAMWLADLCELSGLDALAVSRDGFVCQVCYMRSTCDCGNPNCGSLRCIDGAVEFAYSRARELGLVGRVDLN